jgi:hypothetical protein
MKRLIHWLDTHAGAIQALTALLTVLFAIAALVGVKLQIDASARQQREQSAREIYREFIRFSAEKPDLAAPDYCAIAATETEVDDIQYENYLQFQLYMSEQMLDELPDWEATLAGHLEPHREYLCSRSDWKGDSADVQALIGRFKAKQCAGFKPTCPPQPE